MSSEDDLDADKGASKGKYASGLDDAYEGDLVDDKRNGKGKLTYANGDVYEGSFVDDKRNGKGKLTYANGDVYEGSFVDDRLNGKGKHTYADGMTYEGEWIKNKREGGKYRSGIDDKYKVNILPAKPRDRDKPTQPLDSMPPGKSAAKQKTQPAEHDTSDDDNISLWQEWLLSLGLAVFPVISIATWTGNRPDAFFLVTGILIWLFSMFVFLTKWFADKANIVELVLGGFAGVVILFKLLLMVLGILANIFPPSIYDN